jgi:hypothetical protein
MRSYIIQLGPALIPLGEGKFETLSEPTQHVVFAQRVKYVVGTDMGFFQLENTQGEIVFACPTIMVMWVKAMDKMEATVMQLSRGLSVAPPIDEV